MTVNNTSTSQPTTSHHTFHALVIMALVAVMGVFFALTTRQNEDVSEIENRRLAAWPVFSIETLLDGQYTRNIETYVADHFPGRHYFTEAAFAIRAHRGIHIGDRVIQVKGADTGFEDVTQWARSEETPDTPVTNESAVDQAATPESSLASHTNNEDRIESTEKVSINLPSQQEHSSELFTKPDEQSQDKAAPIPSVPVAQVSPEPPLTAAVEKAEAIPSLSTVEPTETVKPSTIALAPVVVPVVPKAAPAASPTNKETIKPPPAAPVAAQNKPLNVVGGVLLHEGQALFMFQGTDRGAQGYANAVNTWVDLVANKRAGMTTTVVVTPTSSHFYLPPAARARTTSEPKNLAAMRAALVPGVRFADVVSEMEGHQDQPLFYKSDHHWTGLGAYYAYRAWAKAAGVTPLELSAFDKRSVPGVAGSFWSLTQAPELRNADKESYYYVPTTVTFDGTQYSGPQQRTPSPQSFFAEKSRGYIVFLGGDIPLLVSNTSAGTGRTALVVKNSYGNAFAPYLLPHFDRVVVLDYRYVSRNIQDIVDTFGVTDLVFVNATITANSGAHQERMRQVARGSSTAWLTEAEKRRLKQQEDAATKAQGSVVASDATK